MCMFKRTVGGLGRRAAADWHESGTRSRLGAEVQGMRAQNPRDGSGLWAPSARSLVKDVWYLGCASGINLGQFLFEVF